MHCPKCGAIMYYEYSEYKETNWGITITWKVYVCLVCGERIRKRIY